MEKVKKSLIKSNYNIIDKKTKYGTVQTYENVSVFWSNYNFSYDNFILRLRKRHWDKLETFIKTISYFDKFLEYTIILNSNDFLLKKSRNSDSIYFKYTIQGIKNTKKIKIKFSIFYLMYRLIKEINNKIETIELYKCKRFIFKIKFKSKEFNIIFD